MAEPAETIEPAAVTAEATEEGDASKKSDKPVIPPLAIKTQVETTPTSIPAASPAPEPSKNSGSVGFAAAEEPEEPLPPVKATVDEQSKDPVVAEGDAVAAEGGAPTRPPPPETMFPLPEPRTQLRTVTSTLLQHSEVADCLQELDSRLMRCEKFIGPRKTDILPKRENKEIGVTSWHDEVRSSILRSTTTEQVRRIHKLTDNLFQGRIAEFEKKYGMMKVWLENENAEITSVILNLQAKRSFILEHEQAIRSTAEKFRQLHDLREFINPPNLTELSSHMERLDNLEVRGHLLAEQALQLTRKIQEMARSYNTAMNMLAFWLKEADTKLTQAKTSGVQIRKKENQRTKIVFAMVEEETLDEED